MMQQGQMQQGQLQQQQTCSNCGISGHNYKACMSPISSYGLIAFRINGLSQANKLINCFSRIPNQSNGICCFLQQQRLIHRNVRFQDVRHGLLPNERIN